LVVRRVAECYTHWRRLRATFLGLRRFLPQARQSEWCATFGARSLRQLGRLRVQYERERTQLEFLKESESLVGSLPITRCPACLQPTPEQATATDGDCHVCHRTIPATPAGVDVDRRLSSLKRRVGDREAYISDLASLQQSLAARRLEFATEIAEVEATLRRLQTVARRASA
jgi:hypothetical protein